MKLSLAIDVYVRSRRDKGALYINGEEVLRSMCRRLGDQPLEKLSVARVMAYLGNPTVSPTTRRSRQSLVNGFLRFWTFRGVMPILILPVPKTREIEFIPYIYSHAELAALFAAVSLKKHSTLIDTATLRVFLLTLYATGGSVNEVLRMRISQVDLGQSHVTLNGSQRTRKRSIPICSDLRIELERYLKDKEHNSYNDVPLFQTLSGDELKAGYLSVCFQRLLRTAGVARRDQFKRAPRMQDLRATFAVHRLSSWLKNGSDLNRLVPALSAYMGYSGLSAAGKYLSLIPDRFLKDLQKLSANRSAGNWRNDRALMKFLTEL